MMFEVKVQNDLEMNNGIFKYLPRRRRAKPRKNFYRPTGRLSDLEFAMSSLDLLLLNTHPAQSCIQPVMEVRNGLPTRYPQNSSQSFYLLPPSKTNVSLRSEIMPKTNKFGFFTPISVGSSDLMFFN